MMALHVRKGQTPFYDSGGCIFVTMPAAHLCFDGGPRGAKTFQNRIEPV